MDAAESANKQGIGARAMILALDPGPNKTALVVYDPGRSRIVTALYANNDEIRCAIERSKASTCVIEMVEHYGTGMPAGRSIFDTCVWIGRFAETWRRRRRAQDAIFLPRRAVKLALCGSARARDPHVRQALIDRLGAPGRKRDPGPTYGITGDLWAALAVAVAWWEGRS